MTGNGTGNPVTQCTRKIAYPNRKYAKNALAAQARAAQRNGSRIEKTLRPYKCPHCGLWHVGHRQKRRP